MLIRVLFGAEEKWSLFGIIPDKEFVIVIEFCKGHSEHTLFKETFPELIQEPAKIVGDKSDKAARKGKQGFISFILLKIRFYESQDIGIQFSYPFAIFQIGPVPVLVC